MKNKKNNIFLVILFLLILILVLLLPRIYNYVESLKLPKVEKTNINKTIEKKEIDDDTLENLHYPLMRSSSYNQDTYYTLNKFKISDMSNQDILLNAFLDIYEGNLSKSESKGNCTTVSKQFNKHYIELRIKNILGKNLDYNLENFYVPEDSSSNYKGEWVYDSAKDIYIYNGVCKSKAGKTRYYNLEQLIKAEYASDDIVVYYYVGFAKVEGNNYTIYNDPKMENVLLTGSFSSESELRDIYSSMDNGNKKMYKYTFKNNLCSYNEYCLYEGEWVNEF